MSTDCSPSVRLPLELERLIFETTALCYPGMIPKLLLLARHVHEWIEPLLYQVIPIVVYDYHVETHLRRMSGSRMLERLRRGAPAQFFSSAVRDLEVMSVHWTFFEQRSEHIWADDDLKRVLSACGTDIQSLLLLGDLDSKPILSSLAECRPTRVFLISGFEDSMPDLSLPLFRNLTHLFIGELIRFFRDPDPTHGFDVEQEHHWSIILELPRLTHLAVIHLFRPSFVLRILADAPLLRAFAIAMVNTNRPSGARIRTVQDIRTYPWGDDRVVVLPTKDDLTEEDRERLASRAWTRMVDELWSKIDEFIDDKRRERIPAGDYCLLLDRAKQRQ